MPLRRAVAHPHQCSGHSVYYKGKSKEEAYKEMKYYGFNDGWGIAGLKGYFEKHSHQPVSQYIPHCAAHAVQAVPERREASESQDID
jgi:hypothetical protein